MRGFECRMQAAETRCAVCIQVTGVSLNIEVEVLEPCVGGSLPAGDEFSPDGQQHDVVELQGGQGRGVVVPGGDVSGPQGQACAACLRILCFSCHVVAEEGLQRGHGEGARVLGGVESHGRDVERSQVFEDVEGVEGVDLGGGDEVSHDEVSHDELVVAGVGGLLLVVQVQRVNPGEVGLYQGQSERNHRVNFGADATSPRVERLLDLRPKGFGVSIKFASM